MSANRPREPHLFAIVPAAGRSRRMGAVKQLLDVAGRPMLQAVVEPLMASRVAGVVVVTRRGVAEQLPAFGPRVWIILNDDESTEMIHSIRLGLRAWRERELIAPSDGFLVCPADHPGIPTADFDACVAAFRAAPDCIVVAARAGRRGHPILFPASDAAFVESTACDPGLNALPCRFADRVRLVECASPAVAHDLDTLDDYQRFSSP